MPPAPEGPNGTSEPPPASTTAPTTPPEATSTPTGNGTAAGESGGGGGPWLDGLVDLPTVPDGWALLSGAIQGVVSDFAAGVDKLKDLIIENGAPVLAGGVDTFHGFILTLPAPGEPYSPDTWAAPTDSFWTAVYLVYTIMSVFSMMVLWTGGIAGIGFVKRGHRRQKVRELAIAAFLIILGATVVLPLWQHFWNQAALAVAPSGSEFTSTPGNVSKLAIGVVLGAIILAYKAVIILAGLGIHLCFVFLTFALFALWPLGVVMWVSGITSVQTMGTGLMAAFLALGPIQLIKAAILRLVFEMPITFGSADSLWTFIFVAIGVTVAFVGLPWVALKAVTPHAVFAAGGHFNGGGGGDDDNGDRLDEASDTLPDRNAMRSKVAEARGRGASHLDAGGGSNLQTRGTSRRLKMAQGRLNQYRADGGSPSSSSMQTRSRSGPRRGTKRPGLSTQQSSGESDRVRRRREQQIARARQAARGRY